MKKYHLYLWFIALVGLMTSCSQDETDALQTATESNRVTLTASLPEDFAQIGTRALPAAPDNHKLRCILEVRSWHDRQLKVRQEKIVTEGGTSGITFKFELADPGEYKALLWADYIDKDATASPTTIGGLSVDHFPDKYYGTDQDDDYGAQGLLEVKIKAYTNAPEVRDAFFASQSFTKEATALKGLKATLTRPFTKLTIAEKDATNFGYCDGVTVTYKVPERLNLFSDYTSDKYSATMTCNSGNSNFSESIEINGASCKILFSDYILAGDDATMDFIKLEFSSVSGNGKMLKEITIPSGIPLKRNYCVNAAGTLITAEDEPSTTTEMTVDINDTWTTEKYNIPAKVGDYYYSDETWSTILDVSKICIGLVYEVDYKGTSGKIVSLDGPPENWNGGSNTAGKLAWGPQETLTNATDENDGLKNMATIKNLSSDFSNYDAFRWVHAQNPEGTNYSTATTGVWYLPAVNEVAALSEAYVADPNFNEKLIQAGGREFLETEGNRTFWCSTENRANAGWYCLISITDGGSGAGNRKDAEEHVRCIRKFQHSTAN